MALTLSLFCYVRGDPLQSIFKVKIGEGETVSDLKDAIKQKDDQTFRNIGASSLVLWRVSVPCTPNIKDDIERNNLVDEDALQPNETLSDVFPEPLDKRNVHIAVARPVVAVDTSSLLRIFCYVRGGPSNNIFPVKIGEGETVGDLKKLIKEENNQIFRDIDASSLVLWSVSVPCARNIQHDVENLNLVEDNALEAHRVLSGPFPSAPLTDHVHIVINRPLISANLDLSVSHPAEKAHRKIIQDANGALAPSSVSGSASKFKSEQDKRPIYNGRPAGLKGPPLSIYHPAFAEIVDALQNPDRLVDLREEQRVDDVAKLCLSAANIYHGEAERLAQVYPLLESLLGIQINRNVDIMQDGLVKQDIKHSDKKGIAAHVELKNELGVSGQSALQNTLSLRKHLIQPQYDEIRDTTCSPCITISIAGPYISFGGAIFADIFVAEQFTDFIYLGGTKKKILTLSRVFAAVARGIDTLKGYYHSLELRSRGQPPNLTRLFPHPTYFPGKHPSSTLVFSGRFDYEGREAGNYRRSIFEATYNNATVLVKFCESYHGEAHRTLAEVGYAPTLFFCEPLQGGMIMVVMELVDGKDAFQHFLGKDLHDDILRQVKSAVATLHNQDLVFGDLRRPNIMIKKKENGEHRALLIDFDWVGTADQARYPSSLNDSGQIAWATGVRPHGLMRKDHDLEMIRLLNSSVKLN